MVVEVEASGEEDDGENDDYEDEAEGVVWDYCVGEVCEVELEVGLDHIVLGSHDGERGEERWWWPVAVGGVWLGLEFEIF